MSKKETCDLLKTVAEALYLVYERGDPKELRLNKYEELSNKISEQMREMKCPRK